MKRQEKAISMPTIRGRLAAMMAAGTLALSCAGAPLALASDISPSVGQQTGSGATDITIQIKNGATEVGGTETPGNPDGDEDGYGDNIAFSVPTSINFVADSQGGLSGPTNAEIQNHSRFSIHGSALQVDAVQGWNIVEDVTRGSQANSVDFQVGPASDMLNAAEYLTKAPVKTPAAWNINANGGVMSLKATGDISNVSADISARTKIATLHWYITPGLVS